MEADRLRVVPLAAESAQAAQPRAVKMIRAIPWKRAFRSLIFSLACVLLSLATAFAVAYATG